MRRRRSLFAIEPKHKRPTNNRVILLYFHGMAIAVLSVAVTVTVIVLVFVAAYLDAADEDMADDGKGTRERHTDDALRGRGIGRGVPARASLCRLSWTASAACSATAT